MDKLTIYYEDGKKSCQKFAEVFSQYGNVECRKASEHSARGFIFENQGKTGFLFESDDGKIPFSIMHILQRIVLDKKESHLILVSGGRRETEAAVAAREEMQKRGYQADHVYTRYLLEKFKMSPEDAAGRILNNLEEGRESITLLSEKYGNYSKKEFRQHLIREIRAYRKSMREKRRQRD
ncbi:MAG: hypothetical protein ACOX8E_11210 [Ruminococcus sp.]